MTPDIMHSHMLRDVRAQPLAQLRPTPPTRDVAHSNSDSLLLPNQNDKPLAARDARVEKVTLQHCVARCLLFMVGAQDANLGPAD